MKSRLFDFMRRLGRGSKATLPEPERDVEVLQTNIPGQGRDVGVLRLMILQAALKEKRIVESKG